MSIKDRLQDEIKTAMRAKDKARLGALRLISAAIKQREVDDQITLDGEQLIGLLDVMIKQRRDAIKQYEKAERQELADQEQFEIDIIQTFLPEQLTEAEIADLVKAAIEQAGASSMREMGAVMGVLKPQIQGRADASLVSKSVKEQLSG